MTQLAERPTSLTCGIDIGARSVKIAILSHRCARSSVLAKAVLPIRGSRDARDTPAAIRDGWARLLAEANLSARDLAHVASTGTRDRRVARVGPFYGQLTHALGGRLLFPDATLVLDIGVNQIRCDLLNAPTGRQPGLTLLDAADTDTLLRPGGAERSVDQPLAPALAGAPPESLAARAAALLCSLGVNKKVVLTGGMVLDAGFVHHLWSRLVTSKCNASLLISPEAIFAGA